MKRNAEVSVSEEQDFDTNVDGYWAKHTDAESEASMALLFLCYERYFRWVLPRWGSKRSRKSFKPTLAAAVANQRLSSVRKDVVTSPSSPLDLLCSENEESCKNRSSLSLPPTMLMQTDTPIENGSKPKVRRRAARKLTNNEWREIRDSLVLENKQLKKEIEVSREVYQENLKQNVILKSEIAMLHHQQKTHGRARQSAANVDTLKIGETLSHDEIYARKNFASRYDLGAGFKTIAFGCRFPSSSGSEEDCSTGARDNPSSGIFDLNAPPREILLDSAQIDFNSHIAFSANKAVLAAEARKRRIELTRMKSLQSKKLMFR